VVCLYVHMSGSVEEMVQRMATGVARGGTLFLVGHRLVDPRRVRKLVRGSLELSGSLSSTLLPWSGEACLLWSFAYLIVRNLFALVWLLGRPRRSKELEILVLRHELAILRRQASRPKLTRADRTLLASLSRSLPQTAWATFSFKPETLLRWHRELIARRWTYSHRRPGRPPLERSLRELIVRLARENPHWGYKRIVGELNGLGIAVSATSVRKVLLEAGIQPAPQRTHSSWRAFLRAQAASMLACDFLTVETIFLQRIYVLFFISLATRRIEYVACTSNPDGRWVTQQARNP
jgi:putative transposase